MTEFKVVDIPTNATVLGQTNGILKALQENVGKAISVPLDGRAPNNLRKTIRASVSNHMLLQKFKFRTVVDLEASALIVWLEPKIKDIPSTEEANG